MNSCVVRTLSRVLPGTGGLLVLAASVCCAAPPQEPELLFHASFDRFHANAEFAKGKPESSLQASLELRSTEGVRKSGLLVEEGETCTYAVKGNFDSQEATVSMWVKPTNWSAADRRYHHFFQVSEREPKCRVSLYVPGNGTVSLYMEFGVRKEADFRTFFVAAPVAWKINEWHKLVATWSPTRMRLYVDGELGGELDLPNVELPSFEKRRFHICTPWPGKSGRTHRRDDLTVADEVRVYRGTLTSGQIASDYAADKSALSGSVEAPLVRLPCHTGRALVIDGRLDEPAWGLASAVPVRTGSDGFPYSRACRALMTYDADALCDAFRAPVVDHPPVTKATTRDGKLWEDDSFELLLWPDPEAKGKRYQIILNSRGVTFDAEKHDAGWNPALMAAGQVGKDEWTVELRLPFVDLGGAPGTGTLWRANLCRNWWQAPPHKPVFTAWAAFSGSYWGGKGTLVFGGTPGGVQVSLGSDISAGVLGASLRNSSNAPLQALVKAQGKDVQPFERQLLLGPGSDQLLAGSLAEFRETVLSARVASSDGKQIWARYATRLYVKQPIEIAYTPDVQGNRLTLQVDLGNLDARRKAAVAAGQASLRVMATPPGGGTPVSETFDVGELRTDCTMPINWVDGEYGFDLSLSVPGLASVSTTGSLVKPPTPWLTAKAGVTDQVLAPWTPIEVTADTASCWGRTYRVDGPLPASIVNQGQEQLPAAARLILRTAQKASTLAVVNQTPTMAERHRAEYEGHGLFAGVDGRVTWQTFIEYDGLVVSDITLHPPAGGWDIEALTMEIPLRADLAQHIRIPKRVSWDGKTWRSGFQPYVWVGNDAEGFDWFFDSDANWVFEPNDKLTEITVDGDTATVRLRIIAKAVNATKPLRYRFGFQATPVRPLMSNWRAFRYNSHPMKHLTHIGYSASQSTQFALYDVAHPEIYGPRRKKGLAKPKSERVPCFIYGGALCTPNKNPTFDFFKPLWINPFGGGFFNQRRKPHPLKPEGDTFAYDLIRVSQASSYTDYLMWQAENLARNYGASCFYTDMDRFAPDANRLHGCGYTDAFGKSGATYHVVERRAFYKRLTTIARNAPEGPGLYMAHAHDNLVLPYHGFADLFFPGEQYTHQLYKKPFFYLEELDPVAWRVELGSKSSGVNHVFLPEFVRGSGDPMHRKIPGPTESLLAMTCTHDLVTSAAYCHDPTVEEYWGIQIRTGLDQDNTRFVGYWEDGCPVSTTGKATRASVYLPEGKPVVIAVANTGPEMTTTKLTIDRKALGLGDGPVAATDERSSRTLVWQDGLLLCPVEGRNYTFVSLR
ncbi:MAG: hypothetical protein HON70_01030 [Lentisphaerae bacterium]|nr:hypothetical protein [Lentisphaerota bacterium]